MQETETFRLDKENKYYIYGYTFRATVVADCFKKNNYNFCGYIDRNADKLKQKYGITVCTIDSKTVDKESIIYIACYSIDTQFKIAEMLSALGYNNLIFMAAGEQFSREYASAVRKAWERYDSGILPCMTTLPKYENTSFSQKEFDVIEKRGDEVVAWIPIELIYSNPKEKGIGDLKVWESMSEELDIPLVAIKREAQFFECIMDNASSCLDYVESYTKLYGVNEQEKLRERKKILQIWDQEMAKGLEYFCDAPVRGIWNAKGYFNLWDGSHRCFYLLYRGFNLIPMAVPAADYEKYCNYEFFKKNEKEFKEMTLPHPTMYKKLLENKERSFLWVRITQLLWEKIKLFHSFLDMENKDGYWALAFKRYGIENVTCYVETNEKSVKSAMELFYRKDIKVTNILTEEIEADIIWCTDETISISRLNRLIKEKRVVIFECDENDKKYKELFEGISPFFYYIDLRGVIRTVYVSMNV